MPPTLTATEARVIGALMEKSVLTPDQYPMTLNALTNACNQKSARDPVTSMEPGLVQRTVRDLRDKHLVRIEENFRRGVEKYKQRLCNTSHADYQFDPAEFAVVCLLLLRGRQTPGELRAHSGRLHTFPDNGAALEAVTRLMEREDGPLVARLPRTPGRRDSEYMHLLCGPIDAEALGPAEADGGLTEAEDEGGSTAAAPRARRAAPDASDLAERVSRLEAEVAALKARLVDRDEEGRAGGGAG